tara:strand:+ start:3084 stop:5744 length:2661 start_codon:yes stop_codon:yes gene_type:complete
MSKTIFLTFNASTEIEIDDNITVKINNTISTVNYIENFKYLRSGQFETQVPSTYTANQMALNFAFAWNLDYKSGTGDIYANAVDNVVSITVSNDSWTFPNPTGIAINSGAVSFSVPVASDVSILNYSESSTNPCFFVDIQFLIDDGVSPYDIYVNRVLALENQNAIFTLNAARGLPQTIVVFDNNGDIVGKTITKDTSQTSNIEINTVPNGSNSDVTITNDVVSDVVSPFTYSLDGVAYGSSNVFLNEVSGDKTAYVKDALGCVGTVNFSLGDGLVYYSDFKDLRNISHRLEIYKEGFIYTPTEIVADVLLDYPNCKENQEAIKVCGLTVNLLASDDLSFSDLYSEDERVFRVVYKRNDITLFNGFLSTDGLYESFVDSKWYIDLQAIDGIGYLKDLSYVEDSTGLPFLGKQTDLQIISNCLKRTKLTNGIRTSVNIYYTGLSDVDVLDNVYVNTERFIKDDQDTIMDCESVLRSVLEKYNASINFFEGYWYIYRANELFDNSIVNFYNYDKDGNFIDMFNKNLSFSVGSQIDNFYPHHVNSNQKKSVQRSLGIYKVNLKWGNVFPYYENYSLVWDGLTIDDWTINRSSGVTNIGDRGFLMTREVEPIQVVLTSDNYTVSSDNRIEFKLTFSNQNEIDVPFINGGATLNAKVIYVKGGNTYWLDRNGMFGSDTLIQFSIAFGEKDFTLRVISEDLPEIGGYFYIQIWTPGFGDATYPIFISNITLQTFKDEGEAVGKNYTIEKNLNPLKSSNEKVKEMFNGDVVDGTYYATIYENDQTTETATWFRKHKTESKELLRLMAEDRIKMNWTPKTIFEGDYFGYVPYLSVCEINNVNGRYMAIDYVYDAKENITSIKYLQLLNADIIDSDIIYSSSLDYGNVVKPTIRG